MALTKLFRGLRDFLSGFGIGILALYGIQTASARSFTFATQPRWFGCLVLASALVMGIRVAAARKAGA